MESPRDTGPQLRELSDEEKAILDPMTEPDAQKVLDSCHNLLIEPTDVVTAKEMVARLVALNVLKVKIPVTTPIALGEEALSEAS